MATDRANPVEVERARHTEAYLTPAVDFLLVAALTALVALAGVAVVVP